MVQHWVEGVLRRANQRHTKIPTSVRDDIERLCNIVKNLTYYEFYNEEMVGFVEDLSDCNDIDNISDIIVNVGKMCGFDHASIFLLRHGDAITFKKRVCTSYPWSWLVAYDQNRYQFIDPVVLRALRSDGSFLFSEIDSTSPQVERFWRDAKQFGIGTEGCCFVYEFDPGIRIGISFTSTGTSALVEKAFDHHGSDLAVLGQIACQSFVEMCGVFRAAGSELSIDELRFIKMLIDISDPSDASKLIGHPESQVWQSSICRKLGVGTIYQAFAIVSREKLFDDLPFADLDVSVARLNDKMDLGPKKMLKTMLASQIDQVEEPE